MYDYCVVVDIPFAALVFPLALDSRFQSMIVSLCKASWSIAVMRHFRALIYAGIWNLWKALNCVLYCLFHALI